MCLGKSGVLFWAICLFNNKQYLRKTTKEAQRILLEFKDKTPDSQIVNNYCQVPGIGRLERGKKVCHATYKQLQWRMEVEPEENREKKSHSPRYSLQRR